MSKSFDPLVVHPSVQTRPPCGPLELDQLARKLQATIPDDLIAFWRESNGAILKAHDANILSVGEVTDLLCIDGFGEYLLEAGLLPLLYDQESNYICIALSTPLLPRVIYILHDNSPKLLYRHLDSFFEGCVGLVASTARAGVYFYEANGDYGVDAQRTADDLRTATSLMQTKEDWAISIAIQLLDSTRTEEWNELLNGDRFARQEAKQRLRSMSSATAKMILDRDANEFTAFTKVVCDALTIAKMPFEHRDTAIRIERSWMDLNAFFGRRRVDNAIPRLVNWFKDVQKGQPPTDRPDNYLAD